MMRRRLALLGALLALAAATPASAAEPVRVVDRARVVLSDVAEGVDPELADVDLGPAPPPGSSRLFVRDDVLRELRSQGFEPKSVRLPRLVRVESAAKRFTPAELAALVEPHVRQALPQGVALKRVKLGRPLVVSPRAEIAAVRLPKLARRSGEATATATVDFVHDGGVAARVPVTLTLEIGAAAAEPLVKKGARLDLVIQRGAARISASGFALDSAELGELATFRVGSTGKLLRARVESQTLAVVVTP